MSNLFKQNLVASSTTIKAARAQIIGDQTERAQQSLIIRLQDEKADLEAKLASHTDLYPDSEFTLIVGSKDYNAADWVQKLQDYDVALLNKEVELQVALKNQQKYFGKLEE